jgi:hypothetical protein
MKNIPYRETIRSLMYAALGTRPDIAFTVSFLSQFMQNPGRTHWEAMKRVLRYLKGMRDTELVLGDTLDSSKMVLEDSQMQTGDHKNISILFQDMYLQWVAALYPGAPRSSQLLHCPPPG